MVGVVMMGFAHLAQKRLKILLNQSFLDRWETYGFQSSKAKNIDLKSNHAHFDKVIKVYFFRYFGFEEIEYKKENYILKI